MCREGSLGFWLLQFAERQRAAGEQMVQQHTQQQQQLQPIIRNVVTVLSICITLGGFFFYEPPKT